MLTLAAVDADRLHPWRFAQAGDRLTDALVEVEADREAHRPITAELRQLVACAGAVGPHQDLAVERLGVELLKRELEHGGVIGGGVRAGVARPQDAGHALARAVQVAQQRVVAVAALEVALRLLLVGVRRRQRRVDVKVVMA